MRAFVAIRMNEPVEESVARPIDELRHPHDGVRWVPRANLHITLKFLGPAVDSHRLQQLTGGLRQLAAKTEPFEVAAAGIGAFPDLEHPRAIWVGLRSYRIGRARRAGRPAGDSRCGIRIRARETALERASDDWARGRSQRSQAKLATH